VNLEDLSNTKNLTMMMESRAKHYPDEFAWLDMGPLPRAVDMDVVGTLQSTGFSMLLTGEKSRETYGSLMRWDEEFQMPQSQHDGRSFDPAPDLNLLKIQSKLYRFLARCLELILQDLDLSHCSLNTALESISKPSIIENKTQSEDSTEWSSIVTTTPDPAYCPPRPPALYLLRKLVIAKRDEAEEEIWGLRQDPRRFQEAFYGIHVQLQQVLKSMNMGPRSIEDKETYAQAAGFLVSAVYKQLFIWDIVLTNLNEAERLRTSLAAEIHPTKPLPDEYRRSLARLDALESVMLCCFKVELDKVTGLSPQLVYFFEPSSEPEIQIHQLKESRRRHQPPIVGLIAGLFKGHQSEVLGTSNMLEIVQRLMDTDASQRALITAPIARAISELGDFAEIRKALLQHQPMINLGPWDDEAMRRADKQLLLAEKLVTYSGTADTRRFVDPLSAFSYSSHKKRDKDNVERMRIAESKFDAFWEHVDITFLENHKKSLLDLIGVRNTHREVERTPPWEPEESIKRVKSEEYMRTSEIPTYHAISFDHQRQESTLPTLETPINQKIKTRGQADPSKEKHLDETAEGEEGPKPSKQSI